MGITYRRVKLPAGDYFINRGYGILVSMKDIPDFCNSFSNAVDKSISHLDKELEEIINYNIIDETVQRKFVIRGALDVRFESTMVSKVVKKATKTKPEVKDLRPEYALKYKTYKKEADGTVKPTWNNIRVHLNAYVGYMEKISYYASLVLTGDYIHTCDWFRVKLSKLRDYEKEDFKKKTEGDNYVPPPTHIMKKAGKVLNDDDIMRSIIQSFPNVGPVLANKALESKKTIKEFINSMEEELIHIGFNRPTAENIVRLVERKYKS